MNNSIEGRQKIKEETLGYIKQYKKDYGYYPSFAQIGKHFNISRVAGRNRVLRLKNELKNIYAYKSTLQSK